MLARRRRKECSRFSTQLCNSTHGFFKSRAFARPATALVGVVGEYFLRFELSNLPIQILIAAAHAGITHLLSRNDLGLFSDV